MAAWAQVAHLNRQEREHWKGTLPVEVTIRCGEDRHRLRLEPSGTLRLLDHKPGDYKAALAAEALGAKRQLIGCLYELRAWSLGKIDSAWLILNSTRSEAKIRGDKRRELSVVLYPSWAHRRLERERECIEKHILEVLPQVGFRGGPVSVWMGDGQPAVRMQKPYKGNGDSHGIYLIGHSDPEELHIEVKTNWRENVWQKDRAIFQGKLVLDVTGAARGTTILTVCGFKKGLPGAIESYDIAADGKVRQTPPFYP